MLKVLAPAKINLVFEVLGRRNDNYHEISSILTTVSLFDELFFENAERTSFVCDSTELSETENLVIQAVDMMKNVTGCNRNISIKLLKKIPIGAGLGGGSSDAAATLKALNQLWHLNLTIDDIFQISAKLGSDVPFFIHGGTALVQGRGEKVFKLRQTKKQWYTILMPNIPRVPFKTRQLYSQLREQHFTNGKHICTALKRLQDHGCVDSPLLFNTFDKVSLEAFPGIEVYWDYFNKAANYGSHLIGSGPSLFAIGKYKDQLREVLTCLDCHVCRINVVSNYEENS